MSETNDTQSDGGSREQRAKAAEIVSNSRAALVIAVNPEDEETILTHRFCIEDEFSLAHERTRTMMAIAAKADDSGIVATLGKVNDNE